MHLLLSLLLASPAFAQPFPSASSYWTADWSWCDVHLIARAFGTTDDAASAEMQRMLKDGEEARLRSTLEEVRGAVEPTGWAVCPYDEVYTWQDALALAGLWGVDTLETKARIEAKLMFHGEEHLGEELKAAYAARTDDGTMGDITDVTPFFDAGLQWCDAEVLGAYWGTDFYAAKVFFSHKVAAGNLRYAKQAVKQARNALTVNTTLCPFNDLGYGYDDAKVLSARWRISYDEAMARVEDAARHGKLNAIDRLLQR